MSTNVSLKSEQSHFGQSVWMLSVVVESDSLREQTTLVVLARILQMV